MPELTPYCFVYDSADKAISSFKEASLAQQTKTLLSRLYDVQLAIESFRFSSARRELSAIKADLLHGNYPRSTGCWSRFHELSSLLEASY